MSSRILRLRGLPWSASVDDVRAFLGEPRPKEIFLRKRGEKSTGEAFAEFETAEEASEAQVARNNQILGERYIEIFLTTADSLQVLKDEVQEQDTGWVVRLRGLPFAASAEDVLAFFSGLEVLRGPAGVVFTWGRDGRPLGEAYVEFPSEEVQEEALKRDKEKMGPRYVEIFKSTKADMVMACALQRAALRWQKRSSDTGQVSGGRGERGQRRLSEPGAFAQLLSVPPYPVPGGYMPALGSSAASLRLKGLPADATAQEVAALFSDFQVLPEAVELLPVIGPGGQLMGTGMANVRFSSQAAADTARRRQHGRKLRSNIIECLPLAPPLAAQRFAGPTAMYQPGGNPYMAPGMSPMGVVMGLQDLSRLPPQIPGLPQDMPAMPASGFHPRGPGMGSGVRGLQASQQPPEQSMFQPLGSMHPYQAGLPPMSPPVRSPSRPQSGSPLSRGVWAGPPNLPPQSPLQGSMTAFSPSSYQQQMLLQQYMIQQHFLQQQAMGQLPQARWGMVPGQGLSPVPMQYASPYSPGSPLRGVQPFSQTPLQASPQPARPRSRAARSLVMPEREGGFAAAGDPSLEALPLGSLSISPNAAEPTSEVEPDLPATLSLPPS